jgi:2-keto-3-deoxy-L-rhamnonate aldolase RhmA
MPRTAEQVQEEYHLGAQFLVWGTDTTLLNKGLHTCAQELDTILAEQRD